LKNALEEKKKANSEIQEKHDLELEGMEAALLNQAVEADLCEKVIQRLQAEIRVLTESRNQELADLVNEEKELKAKYEHVLEELCTSMETIVLN